MVEVGKPAPINQKGDGARTKTYVGPEKESRLQLFDRLSLQLESTPGDVFISSPCFNTLDIHHGERYPGDCQCRIPGKYPPACRLAKVDQSQSRLHRISGVLFMYSITERSHS